MTLINTSDDTSHDLYVVDSPYEVARWRPLVQWILVVPHMIVLYGLQVLACVVGLIYWLSLVFTGKLNRELFGMMALYERYNARAAGFLMGFSEQYPPFEFRAGGTDSDAYRPVTLNLPEPDEEASRKRAFNFFLAIPHYFVLAVFGIGAVAVALVAWFAVLFTGRWPEGMRKFLVRFGNYYYRVWLYATMVHADYPRFGLSPR